MCAGDAGAAEGLEAERESAATQHQSLTASSLGLRRGIPSKWVRCNSLGRDQVAPVIGAFAAVHSSTRFCESQYVGGLIGGIGMALQKNDDRSRVRPLARRRFADYQFRSMPTFRSSISRCSKKSLAFARRCQRNWYGWHGGIPAALANAVLPLDRQPSSQHCRTYREHIIEYELWPSKSASRRIRKVLDHQATSAAKRQYALESPVWNGPLLAQSGRCAKSRRRPCAKRR